MFPGGYIQEQEVEFLGLEYAFMQLHAIKKLYIPTNSLWDVTLYPYQYLLLLSFTNFCLSTICITELTVTSICIFSYTFCPVFLGCPIYLYLIFITTHHLCVNKCILPTVACFMISCIWSFEKHSQLCYNQMYWFLKFMLMPWGFFYPERVSHIFFWSF